MYRIQRPLETLVNDSWTGGFLAGSLAITLLACGTLVVVTLLRRQWRWLWIGTLTVSCIAVLLAGANIALCRIDLVTLLTPERILASLDPSQQARLVAEAHSCTIVTRQFSGIVVGSAMGVLALSRLRFQPMSQRARLAFVCVAAFSLTAIGAFVREGRLLSGPESGHSEPSDIAVLFGDLVSYANQAFAVTKHALVGLSILGAVWLSLHAVRDARRGAHASRLGILGASALLALGVVAYAGTRAHAHDAYHLLSPIDANSCYVDKKLLPLLPVGPAQECSEGPLVQFLLDQVSVDGSLVSGPLELENVLRGKSDLWHELNPGHKDASLTVAIAAADGREAAPMLPWLEAVKRSGFTRVGALYTISPKPVTATATLGVLTRERCCLQLVARVPTKEEGKALGSWGDLMRSARSSSAASVGR